MEDGESRIKQTCPKKEVARGCNETGEGTAWKKRSSMSDEGGKRQKTEANERGGASVVETKGADCVSLCCTKQSHSLHPSIHVGKEMSGGGRKRERHGEVLGRERERDLRWFKVQPTQARTQQNHNQNKKKTTRT